MSADNSIPKNLISIDKLQNAFGAREVAAPPLAQQQRASRESSTFIGKLGWTPNWGAPPPARNTTPVVSRGRVAPTQKQFWDDVYKAAQASGAKFPELVAAQAALESGWGSRESGRFNYFGQKATRSQEGRDVTTHEEVNGRKVKMPQRFRDYKSVDESIADHLRLWQPKYSVAKDARSAARLLQTGERRYATDSKYVDKVEAILKMQGY